MGALDHVECRTVLALIPGEATDADALSLCSGVPLTLIEGQKYAYSFDKPYPSMPTALPSSSEIVARLLEIHAARKAFDFEEEELLTLLKGRRKTIDRPILLNFGKTVITWENGQALSIKGKGYEFVKALYEADRMRLKVERLCLLVWKNELISQNTFSVMLHRLSEKLQKAHFPYKLIPKKSKMRVEITSELRNNKPVKKIVPPTIIGIKLCLTVNGKNVRGEI